ncbi:MAG: hypothetical protein SH850_10605 [Planctomycetaceae bacterium]|nr:hypothetical protein [Planctomycetaceae bacterium]
MASEEKPGDNGQLQAALPPYIPWKTFTNFVGKWKGTTTPHTVDRHAMSNVPNGDHRPLRAALKYLGHIDADAVVLPPFDTLVKAHGTTQWPEAIRQCVLPAYAPIIKGLPIENASAGQLADHFRTRAKADGQVGEKAVRFWLQAMKEAEEKFSPFFVMRQDRSGGKRTSSKRKPATDKTPPNGKGETASNPAGTHPANPANQQRAETIAYPIFFKGKAQGQIIVPAGLNADDLAVLDLTVQLVRAYAGQATTQGGAE